MVRALTQSVSSTVRGSSKSVRQNVLAAAVALVGAFAGEAAAQATRTGAVVVSQPNKKADEIVRLHDFYEHFDFEIKVPIDPAVENTPAKKRLKIQNAVAARLAAFTHEKPAIQAAVRGAVLTPANGTDVSTLEVTMPYEVNIGNIAPEKLYPVMSLKNTTAEKKNAIRNRGPADDRHGNMSWQGPFSPNSAVVGQSTEFVIGIVANGQEHEMTFPAAAFSDYSGGGIASAMLASFAPTVSQYATFTHLGDGNVDVNFLSSAGDDIGVIFGSTAAFGDVMGGFAPIPEPAGLAAVGASALLMRRRRSAE